MPNRTDEPLKPRLWLRLSHILHHPTHPRSAHCLLRLFAPRAPGAPPLSDCLPLVYPVHRPLHLLEPLGCVHRIVAEGEVGARALYGNEALQHRVFLVEVPVGFRV